MNENPAYKSGFATLIGRPNVGKSTLMNRLIGQKIAITSNKPQTTRNRIQTVLTLDEGQIVFLDTPGIHKAKNKLGDYMVNVAEHTLNDVDVILWLVEPTNFIGAGERHIIEQLKKLGSSCDWDRERFTMDEGCSKAVRETFCELYDKGLIYKGSRIINWCPVCQTSISDAEVEYQEQAGHFWHINYPVVGEEGRFVEIATTRPETLLGDTAVAVNPEDERYTDIVGKMLKLPLTDREIPVIADAYVDKEFGTGCVKITPAHDPNDFEVGKRHNLEEINILNDDGTMNNKCGKYAGMDRYEARKAMVEDLEKLGLLVKVVDHVHNVGTHDRCKTTVEPMIKPQWFVKMADMAAAASEAEKNGEVNFIPDRFSKTISTTGVFPVSSGGVIVSRPIPVMTVARSRL